MPDDVFDNYEDAVKNVRKLKEEFGTGVSTLSLIHNATEESLTFVTSHDWWGHIYNYKTYPQVIGAGKWGGFLHVKTAGLLLVQKLLLFIVANAYAEINEAHYFDHIDWGSVENSVNAAGRQHYAEWEGCIADVNTESDTSPLYKGEISLKS
ncbi:hypothetical protein PTKIN_Ptkin09bG0262200 [Pterospermum kingtungense]